MLTDYDGQRICGVSDHFGSADCRWPIEQMTGVTVFASGHVGEVNLAEAAELAIALWNGLSGLRLEMTTNPKTANIITRPFRLDGRGNILAQCQLPCGFVQPSSQMLCDVDLAEAFVIAQNPPQGRIDIVRTLGHEYGHGWGCPHIGAGNLMGSTYSNSIWKPQDLDIVQLRSRYGQPVPAPTPTPTPVPPQDPVIGPRLEFVDADGRRWRLNGVWEQV